MEQTGKKTFWNGWDAKHLLYVLLLIGNLGFSVGFNYAKLLAIEKNVLDTQVDVKDAKCAI